MRSLQIESERIRAKGGNDELTAGQASTLARNEQVIDRLKEEVSVSTSVGRHRNLRQQRLRTPSVWLRCSAEMSPSADAMQQAGKHEHENVRKRTSAPASIASSCSPLDDKTILSST